MINVYYAEQIIDVNEHNAEKYKGVMELVLKRDHDEAMLQESISWNVKSEQLSEAVENIKVLEAENLMLRKKLEKAIEQRNDQINIMPRSMILKSHSDEKIRLDKELEEVGK
jgi:hypothetical protein